MEPWIQVAAIASEKFRHIMAALFSACLCQGVALREVCGEALVFLGLMLGNHLGHIGSSFVQIFYQEHSSLFVIFQMPQVVVEI